MRKRPGEGEVPDLKIRLAEFKNLQNEIRIVNEDNFPLTAYSLNNEIGIEVDVGYQMGQLVYEMRIPISKPLFGDHNLNLLPGDKVKLAFESGKFDRSDSGVREKRPGFGMGGGGECRVATRKPKGWGLIATRRRRTRTGTYARAMVSQAKMPAASTRKRTEVGV